MVDWDEFPKSAFYNQEPAEPLDDKTLYGDPPDEQDDELIEELLEGPDNRNYFDDAHICPECGEPRHQCPCPINEKNNF